ncbi:RAD52 DNA repair protein [Mycena sanguinolenta]|nr:RAD52 DNA repair protein [Mycena sanguinolenta]
MAGALSGHIISSYESSMSNQSICTDGLISFNPNMHGTQQSLGFNGFTHASTSTSETVYDRVSRLQAKLNQKLGPEYVSQRPGPGGGPKLTYVEGWKVINVANEVFGFDGWSSSIVSLTTDYMDYNEETRRYNIGISAIMRVTLKEGVFHEDVGYGMIENAKAKGMALDKCKKEAVTDGLKRTLRTFGNVLGNCLYDKQYASEVVKIKVPPIKFDNAELYRHPQLAEKPPPGAPVSASASSSASRLIGTSSTPVRAPALAPAPQPQKWQPQQPVKPISAVPSHMGLQTPITTPAGERKVSFAPQVKAEAAKPPQGRMPPPPIPAAEEAGDDSFGFFSDDDAFLASVDLGEGDLGQPIDFEEGAAGSALSSGSEDKAQEAVLLPPPQPQPAGKQPDDRYGPMGLGRTGQGTRPPQQQQSRPNPPPQQKVHNASSANSNVAPGSGSGAPKPISGGASVPSWTSERKPASSGSASGSAARALAIANHSRSSNQNQTPLSGSGASSSPAGDASVSGPTDVPPAQKRPSTPSVGGFHFPPGMPNPFLQNNNNNRPPLPVPVPQGLKRGADAMVSASTRTGMGLSGSGGGTRQPLGTLALDGQNAPQQQQQQHQYQQQGGSDPKRVRR